MAGKPVGTMYVALDLDKTKYTKAQKDILAGAEKNSADINKVFKTVGTSSDAMYDAMRKNIENSLNAIKRSHLSTASEIERAQRTSAEKIKQINEQQYGHQTGIIDKLKANWIAAAAAIGAAMVAISQAWSMAKLGAEIEEARGVLNNLARQYKTTADAIVTEMTRASDGMIANSDLIKIALGGLAKGLNPDQLINLSGAAKILSDTMGVSVKQALTDVTTALETGRVKGLRAYAGASIGLKAAFGDLESKMTETQKVQAMYALTMIHTTNLQKKQTEAVNDAADKFESMEAKYKNYSDTFSVVVMKMTVRLGDYIGAIGKAIQKTAQFFGIGPKFGTTGPGVYDVPPVGAKAKEDPETEYKRQIAELKRLLQAQKDSEDAIEDWEKAQKKATEKAIEETRKASYETEAIGQSQYQKDVARINAEGAAFSTTQVDQVIVYRWAKAQMALADAKQEAENIKMWQRAAGEAVNAMETDIDRGVKETEEKIKLRLAFNEFSIKASSGLLSDTESKIQEAMDLEARKYTYINDLVTRGVINHKEAEEEKTKATEKRIQAEKELSNDFFVGMKLGWDELQQEQARKGKIGADFTIKSFNSMADALADFVMTGKVDFASLANSIIKDLIKIQIQEALVKSIGSISWSNILSSFNWGGGGGLGLDNLLPIQGFHSGGIVGSEASFMRSVPASTFENAPRYHSGLMPDEFPAVLQKGEGVFTKGQMQAMGNQSEPQNVNITIVATDAKSFSDMCKRNPAALIAPITQALQNNKTRTEWKGLLR